MITERESGGEFLGNGTFGLIIRGTLDEMNELLHHINHYTDLNVVYQKSSDNKLYITTEMN